MYEGKTFLLTAMVVIVIAIVIPVANAGLVLTVNGLDTSNPIEIKDNNNIIIAVAGQNDDQKEPYSVSCELGGELSLLSKPDSLTKKIEGDDFLFTFKDDKLGLAMLNLTVGDILDYQLILFKAPDANITVFGIDSDVVEISKPEPASAEPNELKLAQDERKISLTQISIQNTYEPPILVSCPNKSNPCQLAEFATPTLDDKGGETTMQKDGTTELLEITESLYLDPNKVYHVPYPPLRIHSLDGNSIDVVIPSGTTIILAEDWDYGIVIYDNANVYFGEPAPNPNEPNGIPSIEDTNNPIPPVWVVGENTSLPFFNNFCGIFVERTAGTKCKLDNICLRGFYYGLQIDQQLDLPVSNINSFGCYNGILSFGPNKILNSSVSYYGMWSSEWSYDGYAYEFMSESLDGTITFGGSNFEIYNCLADDGDYGFTANGLYEPNEAPVFYSRDCAATNSYTGFNCVNGLLSISVICPGLYDNYQNKNFPELPFTAPVYEVNDPFVINSNDYRVFLDPNSLFVDSGSGLSAFPGWTTSNDGSPDNGIGDIWPHYQITGFDKWLKVDLNTDDSIDTNDLVVFADQWLVTNPNSADFNNDQTVNFLDFAMLSNQWLSKEISIKIFDPETIQTIEPNNIHGYVGIEINNIPFYTGILTAYLDNQLISNTSFDWENEGQWIGLQTDTFSNGWHTLRFVTTDIYGDVINHKPINLYFNNLLYKVDCSDYFHPDNDYNYCGFYDGNSTLEAVLTNLDGQTIWSNNYTGTHINIVIPGATFNNQQLCKLSITEDAKSGTGVTKKDLAKKFHLGDYSGVKMVIVMPNKDVFKARKPAIFACVQACENQNLIWAPLYCHDVTPDNLTNLYNRTSVKFIYWAGHANSHVGDVQRTHTICWQNTDKGWWDFINNWEEIPVLSWIDENNPLPSSWDDRGFSLWGLGMHDSWNKKIVFVDGCLSGVYSDMAQAYGVFSLQGQGSRDQIYIGWKTTIQASSERIGEFLLGDTTAGVKMFWERLGIGDSVEEAFEYINVHGSTQTKRSFFGLDTIFDYGGEDDNIVYYGNGIISQIELEP